MLSTLVWLSLMPAYFAEEYIELQLKEKDTKLFIAHIDILIYLVNSFQPDLIRSDGMSRSIL